MDTVEVPWESNDCNISCLMFAVWVCIILTDYNL